MRKDVWQAVSHTLAPTNIARGSFAVGLHSLSHLILTSEELSRPSSSCLSTEMGVHIQYMRARHISFAAFANLMSLTSVN